MQANKFQDTIEPPFHAKHFAKVAVALPIAAICLAWLQAHWNFTQGETWNLPMRAYDPRDILRGKYLNVSFDYKVEQEKCDSGDCCVCHQDVNFDQSPPSFEAISCAQAASRCRTWLSLRALSSNYRYFVPEEKSLELEERVIEAVRDTRARVEFVLDQRRRPQITALLIDDEPI